MARSEPDTFLLKDHGIAEYKIVRKSLQSNGKRATWPLIVVTRLNGTITTRRGWDAGAGYVGFNWQKRIICVATTSRAMNQLMKMVATDEKLNGSIERNR